jgi:hypothetical protein
MCMCSANLCFVISAFLILYSWCCQDCAAGCVDILAKRHVGSGVGWLHCAAAAPAIAVAVESCEGVMPIYTYMSW